MKFAIWRQRSHCCGLGPSQNSTLHFFSVPMIPHGMVVENKGYIPSDTPTYLYIYINIVQTLYLKPSRLSRETSREKTILIMRYVH